MTAKHLKPLTNDTQSIAEVVGIVLMLTVVVLAATALHVSMGQSGEKMHMIPMVSMKQQEDHLIITEILYGPVENKSVTVKAYTSNGATTQGIIWAADTRYIGSGDKITFNGLVSGEKYTVRMIYSNSQVGIATLNYH